MTHHSFVALRLDAIVGVTPKKGAKKRGGARGTAVVKDPPARVVRKALKKLNGMKIGRFDLRKVKITKYAKLGKRSRLG